jgi:hypothetical protein
MVDFRFLKNATRNANVGKMPKWKKCQNTKNAKNKKFQKIMILPFLKIYFHRIGKDIRENISGDG